jgi:molecular chaperone GrpE (heat shock protein)
MKDELICAGVVLLDELKRLLPWKRASRSDNRRSHAAIFFPPGDWRKEVLDDFTHWLLDLDKATPAPHAFDLSHDLFQVMTELSAFRQEVKRQSREQNKLNDELVRMEELYREALARVNTRGEDLAGLRRDVQLETEKSVFLLFADLRDGLQRGLEEARRVAGQKSFFRRPPPDMDVVQEGYQIALDRFDRTMAKLGIRKVATTGEPFDSRFMVAIATRPQPGVQAGMVVEESISGYVRGEEVLRTAQVVVASEPAQ